MFLIVLTKCFGQFFCPERSVVPGESNEGSNIHHFSYYPILYWRLLLILIWWPCNNLSFLGAQKFWSLGIIVLFELSSTCPVIRFEMVPVNLSPPLTVFLHHWEKIEEQRKAGVMWELKRRAAVTLRKMTEKTQWPLSGSQLGSVSGSSVLSHMTHLTESLLNSLRLSSKMPLSIPVQNFTHTHHRRTGTLKNTIPYVLFPQPLHYFSKA